MYYHGKNVENVHMCRNETFLTLGIKAVEWYIE